MENKKKPYRPMKQLSFPFMNERNPGRPNGQFFAKKTELLKWLLDHIRPDIKNKEMAEAVGCSVSQVKRYITALCKEEYLKSEKVQSRGISGFWTERNLTFTGKRGIV